MKTKFRSHLKSFIILSSSNLLLKVYGEVYRIFLIRRLGAEPFGLIGMVFPFYRLLVIFITMGLPAALVRLIAIEKAKNNLAWILQTKIKASYLVSIPALIIAFFTFLFAKPLGSFLFNDPRTGVILKYLAFAINLNSLSLIYRGYFHGLNRIAPLAWSEAAETLGESAFVLFTLYTTFFSSVEGSAQTLAQGFVLGELTCFLLLFGYDCLFIRPSMKVSTQPSLPGRKLSCLLNSSFPLMAQQLILSFSRIADGILLPQLLKNGGLSPSLAATELGEYWGMATPLIFFPLFLFSPISTIILPATAQATVRQNLSPYLRKIRILLGFALVYGIVAGGLLLRFGSSIALFFYQTTAAAKYLPFLLPALPFMVINHILIPVAEGLGKQGFLLRATLVMILIKTGVAAAFVPLPTFGLAGAAWSVTISQALYCCLLLRETVFSSVTTTKWFLLFHPKYLTCRGASEQHPHLTK